MRRILLAAAMLMPAALPAQSPGGRYVQPGSWTQPFLDHLDRAGMLPGLDPLTRPLRRTAVASAVLGAALTDDRATQGTLRLLAREFEDTWLPVRGDVRWSLDGRLGIAGSSDASRWMLRPQAEDARLYPKGMLEAALELPHLSLVTTPWLDNGLKYDSTYTGRQDRFVAGRNAAAYLLASWQMADVFFGTVDRNWGPPELEGLLISPAPHSSEHFGLRLGTDRLRLELNVAQLDPLVPWDSTTALERWRVSHRLVVQPSATLAFSLSESVIAAGDGVPWRYLNPVTMGWLTTHDGAPEANALLGADVVWRIAPRLRVFGQVLVDDIQVDDDAQTDKEPPAYGLTVGASGGARSGRIAWTATYTRVSNLAYRTPLREHQYTSQGVGIARNWSDYDEATVRATLLAAPGLLVGASLTLQRQGEGDMRERYPPADAYADSLTFLTGTVQRALQPGVEAAWSPSPWVSVTGAVAWRTTDNTGNVAGAGENRLLWRLGVSVRRRFAGTVGG